MARNMCSAHIFKLCIMYLPQNMCSAHIFKVAYMYLYTRICGALAFFAGTCSLTVRFCGHRAFTVCPLKWTLPIQGSAKFRYYGIFTGAFLRANNVLLPNIFAFTLNFSIRRQSEIPVLWNFVRQNMAKLLELCHFGIFDNYMLYNCAKF